MLRETLIACAVLTIYILMLCLQDWLIRPKCVEKLGSVVELGSKNCDNY
jgi:hypothetical protein